MKKYIPVPISLAGMKKPEDKKRYAWIHKLIIEVFVSAILAWIFLKIG